MSKDKIEALESIVNAVSELETVWSCPCCEKYLGLHKYGCRLVLAQLALEELKEQDAKVGAAQ